MFRKKVPKKKYIYLKDIKGLNQDKKIDLYSVTGLAPIYTFPHTRQSWGNVFMTWWVLRPVPFRVNYEHIFGEEYTEQNMTAVNQLWLLEEAELYKKWIDGIYPEEETKITKLEYPYKPHESYELDFDGVKGSLWSAHPFWHYAFRVCYYMDTTHNKKLN